MYIVKEYFSLTGTQAVSNSNKSGKQKIEVKTNDDDDDDDDNNDEVVFCFICIDEEVDDNIEDSTWLQFNNCNLWAHLHCIQNISEQEVTQKMKNCDDETWFCKNCV